MKRTILAVIIALTSVSAFANDTAATNEAVSHASRFSDANQNRMDKSARETARANNFAHMAIDSYNHQPAATRSVAAQAAADAQSIADHMQSVVGNDAHQVAQNSAAMAQAKAAAAAADSQPATSAPASAAAPSQPAAQTVSPTATVGEALDGKQTNSSINAPAGSLNPNMDVKTAAGVVKAGTLPADAQVKVGMDSVFAGAVRKGGNNHDRSSSRSEHGTGNGGNNAANSNSAHGLGGGNHIGGGSAQSGSRNVGHW
ncbi:hypothetical protein AXL65_02415 [Salmonella enterica subsp. enterica]|nr:hypothetical protein [Salmonella enterica subsp. enterica]